MAAERLLSLDPQLHTTDPAEIRERTVTVTWFGSGQPFAVDVDFVRTAKSGWRITALRMDDPTPAKLRAFSLRKVEAAANTPDPVVIERLTATLASAAEAATALVLVANAVVEAARYKLVRPAGRRLPDDHYANVARAYREAVAVGLNPRKVLAMDSGAPADTVARWVSEARRRGLLGAAEPGRAGEI